MSSLKRPVTFAAIAVGALACWSARASAETCGTLAQLKLPDAKVETADAVAAGAFTPPKFPRAVPTAFCRVTGVITPTRDSTIRFELWLPATGWSGRYESVGNGGFAGGIRYDEMFGPLAGGSAVASTDDGHNGPAVGPGSATWALGHPEKIVDYGWRAVHLTAVTSKAITTAFYARAPKYSYFSGCSKGGQEAFMEAQRFPDDFDGVIGGAAANQWTDLFSSFSWAEKMHLADRETYISAADLTRVSAAVTAACDEGDGIRDGLVGDPLRCRLDPARMDLTPKQRAVMAALYTGPQTTSGRRIYPGQAYGGEGVEWASVLSGPSFEEAPSIAQESMYGDGFFANFVYQDPSWTFRKFDIDKTPAEARERLGQVLNAEDVAFAGFKARGGKFIQYHGLADAVVTPLGAVSYYDKVVAAQGRDGQGHGAPAALAATQAFYRLFLAPGVGHCAGGPGPSQFGQFGGDGDPQHDLMAALEQWVEKGVAPDQVIATKYAVVDQRRTAVMTRPICAYPKVAFYSGSGDPKVAESFVCRAPGQSGL